MERNSVDELIGRVDDTVGGVDVTVAAVPQRVGEPDPASAELLLRLPLIRLLAFAFDDFAAELNKRLAAAGYDDLRQGHGCVFGTVTPQHGARLTEIAERSFMTKQSAGEFVSDLEHLGYVERVADPSDGRAKIIGLTDRGREAWWVGRHLIEETERDWAGRYGEEQIAALREALETIAAGRVAVGTA